MSADIVLEEERIRLEGGVVEMTAHDLELDASARRSTSSGKRRALVHDPNDGLTLNWAGDYPGGVTIQGTTRLQIVEGGTAEFGGEVKAHQVWAGDLRVDEGAQLDRLTAQAATIANLDVGAALRVQVASPLPALDGTPSATSGPGGRHRGPHHGPHRGSAGLPDVDVRPTARGPLPTYVDLVEEIRTLRREIISLKARVTELE